MLFFCSCTGWDTEGWRKGGSDPAEHAAEPWAAALVAAAARISD